MSEIDEGNVRRKTTGGIKNITIITQRYTQLFFIFFTTDCIGGVIVGILVPAGADSGFKP
jgi:hypothetical protein